MDLADTIRKRKKFRITTDSDNSGGDDHETDTILRGQLRRAQKKNKAGQVRLEMLEAAVDKLMQQSCQEGLS